MRRGSIGRYFEALSQGDPVAIGITIGFGVLAVIVAIFGILELRDRQKERDSKSKTKKPKGRP